MCICVTVCVCSFVPYMHISIYDMYIVVLSNLKFIHPEPDRGVDLFSRSLLFTNSEPVLDMGIPPFPGA